MSNIPFQSIDWTSIEKVRFEGETGVAYWQTIHLGGLRIRSVEYSKDHWCSKGHIVHCLEGSFITEHSSGKKINLSKNESYVMSGELSSHRSFSENGVKFLIIDGDFFK